MTRKLHVKTGDNVQVISGKDLGKTGKVIAVDFENARVKVSSTLPTFYFSATNAVKACALGSKSTKMAPKSVYVRNAARNLINRGVHNDKTER